MNLKGLIEELTNIYNEYGDIEIYETVPNDDGYYEILPYMKSLRPMQIHTVEYQTSRYDYLIEDEVTETYCSIEEAPLGAKLPPDTKEVHIGLIL